MVLTASPTEQLAAEVIPGGFIVTVSGDETRWWSVVFRGTHPLIASHLREPVDPHSREGRHVLAAIRQALR